MRRLAPVMPDIRCRGVCLTMNNGQIADTPVTVNAPGRQVIPVKGPVHRWIEPWYLAYAILGALASGLAVILIPLVVTNSGGSSDRFGYDKCEPIRGSRRSSFPAVRLAATKSWVKS